MFILFVTQLEEVPLRALRSTIASTEPEANVDRKSLFSSLLFRAFIEERGCTKRISDINKFLL